MVSYDRCMQFGPRHGGTSEPQGARRNLKGPDPTSRPELAEHDRTSSLRERARRACTQSPGGWALDLLDSQGCVADAQGEPWGPSKGPPR